MNVEAAAFAGILEKRGITGEPQALLLDARIDAKAFLQLEALTHAFPDVLGRHGSGLLVSQIGFCLARAAMFGVCVASVCGAWLEQPASVADTATAMACAKRVKASELTDLRMDDDIGWK